ncbi:hypothetical protein G3A_13305 [Bacillus sp. 17376]|nr:hypothetical protein G3A_13305 [Bacillus sp. 17376]
MERVDDDIDLKQFLANQEQSIFYRKYKGCSQCGEQHLSSSGYCEECEGNMTV